MEEDKINQNEINQKPALVPVTPPMQTSVIQSNNQNNAANQNPSQSTQKKCEPVDKAEPDKNKKVTGEPTPIFVGPSAVEGNNLRTRGSDRIFTYPGIEFLRILPKYFSKHRSK